MFVYQDDKLYVQKDKDSIVGVNFGSNGASIVEGTEKKFDKKNPYRMLTSTEVRAKFQISDENEFKFPVPAKEPKKVDEGVDKNESTRKTKSTTRKSTRKR